jgi:hypothetical protein
MQRALLLHTMPPNSSNGNFSTVGSRLSQNENHSDAYSGKPLPLSVALLVGSSVTFRETGRSFVLEDINHVYLAPVLGSL